LERGWGIGEAKGHDETFEVAISGAEGGLPFIAGLDAKEVVGATKVDLGEDFSTSEAIEGFRDEGKGVSIFYGNAIEASIVDAKAE
jgi:hypothetical protein